MRADREANAGRLAVRCARFVAALAVAWFGVLPAADAAKSGKAAEGLTDADKVCVACHDPGGSGAAKPAPCAEGRQAFDGRTFERSLHGSIGCEGCHDDITMPDHPANVKRMAENSCKFVKARSEACRACHGRVSKAYDRSLHAVSLREGKEGSPVCADCHKPHAVTPASVQDGLKNACVGCHADTVAHHEKWLPNAASHMRAVACSACHAPAALRRVDLRLQRNGQPLTDTGGSLRFEERARAADANADGLDANELRALLADLESDGPKVVLKGRVELRTGQDAHELPAKAQAIRDCVKCHDEDAAPFQSVTLSILDADGRPVRYDAHKEVLGSAITWDAMRGFYAIGGTRFKLLDYILVIGLAGGIAVPGLHYAVRRLMARRAKTHGASQ